MTPEERANVVIQGNLWSEQFREGPQRALDALEACVAETVRAAVAEERERLFARLSDEGAYLGVKDDVIDALAAAIRART